VCGLGAAVPSRPNLQRPGIDRTNEEKIAMSTMQKVLLGITLSAILLCSTGGIYGYYRLWPHIHKHFSTAIEEEIASSVEATVAPKFAAMAADPNQLLVYEQDLDFNTYTDNSGESGVDVTNGVATIYNSVLTIGPNGIDVYLADMHLHGTPAITAGRFDLIDVESDGGLTGKLLDPKAIETGIERGLNAALAQASVSPDEVLANEGYLAFWFGPETENPLCSAGGLGCEPAAPLTSKLTSVTPG
jgi:hypothetical protein